MLVGEYLRRSWVDVDTLGSQDGWAFVDTAAVTGLVRGLVCVMFGAAPVGARVFLFWEPSQLLKLHFGTPLVSDGPSVIVSVSVVFCCLLSPASNGPTLCSVLTEKEIVELLSRSQQEDDIIERRSTQSALRLRAGT